MTYSPIAIKRRNILGDLYGRCEACEERIPVYLTDKTDEPIGFADEGLGHYADAFRFHVPEDICKKISTSQYNYGLDYEFCDEAINKKVRLTSILLITKENALIRRNVASTYTNQKK